MTRVMTGRCGLWLAVLFVVVALALRWATFGNPNLGVDEQFYLLVGERMHQGALPYVDVWDRKPLGLFLLYWLFACLPDPVIAYQVAATLFAAATAWVIARVIAWTQSSFQGSVQGAVLGGLAYLLLLGPFDGFGGQAPVFYNLFVAAAFALVWRADAPLRTGVAPWRVDLAMGLCGIAIAVKQTAVFESAFLGLWCAANLWRAGRRGWALAPVLRWMALGVAPMALIGAWYVAIGHGGEWWHAMVTSSLNKQMRPAGELAFRGYALALRALPAVVLAVCGLAVVWRDRRVCVFLGGWLLAALAGLFALFSFYAHYALPLLVPLSVAAGLALGQGGAGRIGFAAFVAIYTLWYDPTDVAWNRQARADMVQLASLARAHDGGRGMLVFDGPPYLYAMTGERFLSPLVFPHHLNHHIEHNVSHLDTDREIDRILAARPGVVVISRWPRNAPVNWYATNHVRAYIGSHCQRDGMVYLHEQVTRVAIGVFGDCR